MNHNRLHISSFSLSRNLLLTVVISVISTTFFLNCGSRRHDQRLEKISEVVADSPEDALDSLEGINKTELDEYNLAFYNLLYIKAHDKAYIVHTSDSLILSVIDYYTDHPDDTLTPEALYYGGRVYSDLGDFPTALNYFRQALDQLPETTPNIILRGNVLSQTGRLLEQLGLFRQSLPYIKEVIEININTNDTVNLAYNNRMLGSVFMEMQEYDSAEYYFKKSLTHLNRLPSEFGIETQVFQAANKCQQEDFDSALILIRPTIGRVSKEFKSYTLACAAEIYLESHLLDSAYLLSHLLATDPRLNNRKSGYSIMFSPELRKLIPHDSLEQYLSDYKITMEDHFYNRQSEETLIQNSQYNYQVHDRNRQKAELKSRTLSIYLLTTVCCVLTIIIGFLVLHIKKRNKIINLQTTINNLNKIIQTLNTRDKPSVTGQQENRLANEFFNSTLEEKITEQSLKDDIKAILTKIQESAPKKCAIPDSIISSDAYKVIRKHITEKTIILNSEAHIWDELENIVLEQFPMFLTRLRLLLGDFPDEQTLRLSLLIKCGVTSAHIGRLLGRSKSSISYRRTKLSEKILGEHSNTTHLDDIIRAL